MSPMTTDEARGRLAAEGVGLRDAALPGESPANLRMGSLRVVTSADSIDIVAWDYGMDQVLLRCRTLEEAVGHVVERWKQSPSSARRVARPDFDSWVREMDERVASIATALDAGSVVSTELTPGSVVDRFGNLDGFLLYPAQTPMQQRALPPSVLDPNRPALGHLSFGVAARVPVLARRIAPAFAQPGGGVMFRLTEPSDTVRDLVARGELVLLSVEQDPA